MRSRDYYIGITGHRNLGKDATRKFVAEQINSLLQGIKQEHENTVALSALAEGADRLFAEVALRLGFRLEAVLPFEKYEQDFEPKASLPRFRHLLNKASKIHKMAYLNRSNEAYFAAGKWIVDHCDLLVAVWDGRPSAGKGGTADVVHYAVSKGRAVVHVDIINEGVRHIQAQKAGKHGQV